MKRIFFALRTMAAVLCTIFAAGCASRYGSGHQLNLRPASLEEGRRLISTSDAFTKSLNTFDLTSRLQEQGLEASEENYLELGRRSVQEWSNDEKKIISRAVDRIRHRIDSCGYELPIPEEIVLVKTSMVEEGGAGGYTRGNTIYLCPLDEVRPEQEPMVQVILAHELFHVMTRANEGFRRSMYAQIGFEVLDENIDFGPELTAMRITNPDVNRYDSYSMFRIDGEDIPCTMLYINDKPYTGGPFFLYGRPALVPLDKDFQPIFPEHGGEEGNTAAVDAGTDSGTEGSTKGSTKGSTDSGKPGLPLFYSTHDAENFYDLMGMNTGYIINPEEVLADNFAYALLDIFPEGHASPEVTERLRAVMTGLW